MKKCVGRSNRGVTFGEASEQGLRKTMEDTCGIYPEFMKLSCIEVSSCTRLCRVAQLQGGEMLKISEVASISVSESNVKVELSESARDGVKASSDYLTGSGRQGQHEQWNRPLVLMSVFGRVDSNECDEL
ncbi:hypothetical protein LWI29_020923 [Acer saccharum]|uniref:Uncharacterized protein n=1 Tax=Acer saccharum TaxID=4024 RepID=A0AA39VS78_ACESA|nr:hypothetical protein LWI29_020923 [Acer saccharum]